MNVDDWQFLFSGWRRATAAGGGGVSCCIHCLQSKLKFFFCGFSQGIIQTSTWHWNTWKTEESFYSTTCTTASFTAVLPLPGFPVILQEVVLCNHFISNYFKLSLASTILHKFPMMHCSSQCLFLRLYSIVLSNCIDSLMRRGGSTSIFILTESSLLL